MKEGSVVIQVLADGMPKYYGWTMLGSTYKAIFVSELISSTNESIKNYINIVNVCSRLTVIPSITENGVI